MKRLCPECKLKTLRIGLFGYKETYDCSHCLAQFELNSIHKWLMAFVGAFIFPLALFTGIYLQSWTVFLIIGVLLPLVGDTAFVYFTKLKLVGLKGAIRARGI